MNRWAENTLYECEIADCICSGCEHCNDHQHAGLGGMTSCCARHTGKKGVVEDRGDICGILQCPDYKEKKK